MHIARTIRRNPRRSRRPLVSKLLMVSALAFMAARIALVPEVAMAAGPSGPMGPGAGPAMAPALPKTTAPTPPVAPHVQVFEILPGQEPMNVAPDALTATVVPNSSPLPQGAVDDSTAPTASGGSATPEDATGTITKDAWKTNGAAATNTVTPTGVVTFKSGQATGK